MIFYTTVPRAASHTEPAPRSRDCPPADFFGVGPLRPIGRIVAEVVGGVAFRAASYWLVRADEAGSEDRIACLETADAILQKAGLRWGDIMPGVAA